MKTKVIMSKTIQVQEGKRILTMTFQGLELMALDSTLPYKKSIDDWVFYSKAIAKIIKEIRKPEVLWKGYFVKERRK